MCVSKNTKLTIFIVHLSYTVLKHKVNYEYDSLIQPLVRPLSDTMLEITKLEQGAFIDNAN